MTRPVAFRPEADAEVLETQAWYASRRAELGAQFAAEVALVVAQIAANPRASPATFGDIRRAVFRRFPYAIYFREHFHVIVVLAVHGRQSPARWQSRR